MEKITMSRKEIKYTRVINEIINGILKQKEAAEILQISIRQVKRLCKRYRSEGIPGICHKNRGKPGNRKISNEIRIQIINLIKSTYADFGPQLIHEQLKECHGISVSSEWIRKEMIKEGIWSVKKTKAVRIHQRRDRRERRGELIQIDGSYHKWFEDRGPKCCLLVAIDDATSELCELRFEDHETTEGYMKLMKNYIKCRGKPITLYSDRLNIFRGKDSQFKRALKELDINIINANSPQAKGRVERANAILQDRLIKLMRLKGIDSMESGNNYLEEYRLDHNKRYGKSPKNEENAHRVISESINLNKILCIKEKRKVTKDLSIHYTNRTYNLKSDNFHRLQKKTAIISEISGKVHIEIDGKEYGYKIYEEQPFEEAMNRKEVDAWINKKQPLTAIEKDRRRRRGF